MNKLDTHQQIGRHRQNEVGWIKRAAADPMLETPMLLEIALEEIIEERATDELG